MDNVTNITHPADKYLVPTHIKLGYRTLVIEPRLMDDFGEYINNENKILYNSKQTPPELVNTIIHELLHAIFCLLYTSPSPRDLSTPRMPSSA